MHILLTITYWVLGIFGALIALSLLINYRKHIGETLMNWREVWMWPLIGILTWLGLIQFAYWKNGGRYPQDSFDWLVGLGGNILVVIVAITIISITRESNGTWWKKEELIQHPHLAWTACITKISIFALALWALKH